MPKTHPKPKTAKLANYSVYHLASDEFHELKREIFTYNSYFFESNNPHPTIIDAGAHIGLATLYFKKLFPGAKIFAIEPNPVIFEILEKNIFENQLNNVTALNTALFDNSASTTPFFIDQTDNQWFSTASLLKNSWTGDQRTHQIQVPTTTLSELIQEPVDFLKMDIEGAETKVLKASYQSLPLIKQLIIEFHPTSKHRPQELISLLEPQFQLTFSQKGKSFDSPKKLRGLFYIHGKNRTLE